MNRSIVLLSLLTLSLLLPPANLLGATKDRKKNTQVRYRSGKVIDFEKLLIQGQVKRPEISIVTGDGSDRTDGLLRLREDFLDRIAQDYSEEVK